MSHTTMTLVLCDEENTEYETSIPLSAAVGRRFAWRYLTFLRYVVSTNYRL